MNPLAWLISFFLPACGFAGAQGLPVPPPMDATAIVRPATPNTALAGPESLKPIPDIFVPPFPVSPDRLFTLIRTVAASEPRTYEAAIYPDRRQVDYVVRSAVFNFPDLVMVQVLPEGQDGSDLILWSRSVYGHSDLGVNHKRLITWLAALRARLSHFGEK
ncbi:MAG TPA: DUF1499 domain-containing protein [Rhodopila sp.]|uniref:DUF1499 domain-containing protein n=1 Tax=Rhodopila sp. TaxID=2480087 RepID=UPI002CF130DF|nr:DUF1499 domain-containing protein [Rhodopila sp.]HVY14083.1 DUF1499 domain-containing protein [Rhodopila sp.]